MTKKQLFNYLKTGDEIEFNYNSKRYGIERRDDGNGGCLIYFWEWHNESTFDNHFSSYEDFEANAKIDGLLVVEILKDIDDADVF